VQVRVTSEKDSRVSSSRLTSITRQQGAPSDDLVQTNPMPAASRMERALTSADAVVTGPSCGFGCALPKKQDAAAGVATVAMAAAPTRARAAYISASCQPADCFAQSSKIAMVRSLGSA
jgi:hypothetical protein